MPANRTLRGSITAKANYRESYTSVTVDVDAVQDLNGYDYPWVGGAGDNFYVGYTGTITSSTYGVTAVFDDNAIEVTGTAILGGGRTTLVTDNFTLPAGTYYLRLFDEVDNGDKAPAIYLQDGTTIIGSTDGNSFTVASDITTANVGINVSVGKVYDYSVTVGICKSDTTEWTPYENICPITGWTGAEVWTAGINQWDEEWQNGYYMLETGAYIDTASRICSKNFIPVIPGANYYANVPYSSSNVFDVVYYDSDKNYIGNKTNRYARTFTTPDNCHYINFSCWGIYGTTYNNDISINYPATDTSYHAYTGATYTYSFGQTVYGGTLDALTGEVTVTMANIASYAGETINEPWLSSMDVYESGTTPTTGAQVVYTLSTPTTISTSAQSITPQEYIWADTGDVTVEYGLSDLGLSARITLVDPFS